MTLREISSNHNDTGRIKRYSNLNTILGSPDTVTETPGSSLYDIIYRQKFMVPMRSPNHGHSRMS